jgi:hypothetical protein
MRFCEEVYYHPLPPPKIGGGVLTQASPSYFRRGQGVVITFLAKTPEPGESAA